MDRVLSISNWVLGGRALHFTDPLLLCHFPCIGHTLIIEQLLFFWPLGWLCVLLLSDPFQCSLSFLLLSLAVSDLFLCFERSLSLSPSLHGVLLLFISFKGYFYLLHETGHVSLLCNMHLSDLCICLIHCNVSCSRTKTFYSSFLFLELLV